MKKQNLITAFLMLLCIYNSFGQNDDLNRKITPESPKHLADIPNNGITSPMHQKYMSKIVFSKNESAITQGVEIESEFASKFKLGELIYFKVYMNNSLSNYVSRLYKEGDYNRYLNDSYLFFMFKFYIDDMPVLFASLGDQRTFSVEEKQKWTIFRGRFNEKDPGYLGAELYKDFLAKAQDKLTLGDHKVKIEVYPTNDKNGCCLIGPVIASGEFTLTVSGNAINPDDESMCLPKAKMQDKAIEAGMLKAFNSSSSRGLGKSARIMHTDWTIVRNETTGIILRRSIDGIIAITKDGKCKYQVFGFCQDYDGSKYLNNIYIRGEGSSTDLNCGCIK